MSGFITYTSNTDRPVVGEHNRLVVEDNGEGAEAPPDMSEQDPGKPG